jgi:hypothetical protein
MNEKTQMRQLARKLGKETSTKMMGLGEVLQVIRNNRWYMEWGFATWTDYIEDEVGIGVGSAYEWMSIAKWASDKGLDKKLRDKLIELGRCKAYQLSRMYVSGAATAKTWIEKAETMTVQQLRSINMAETPQHAPKTIGLWMHGEDRREMEHAIKLARRETDGTWNGELLGYICREFNAQRAKKRKRG